MQLIYLLKLKIVSSLGESVHSYSFVVTNKSQISSASLLSPRQRFMFQMLSVHPWLKPESPECFTAPLCSSSDDPSSPVIASACI